MIVRNFERILAGEPPLIRGDGKQILDYIYVDDVVDATLSALGSDVDGEVINVSSGVGVSINELTQLMLEVAGSAHEPEFAPRDATHGTYRVGENQLLRERLGFQPATSLRDGLARTFEWMKGVSTASGSTRDP